MGRGQRIELRKFGVFSVKPRKTGIGRNPRTGEEVSIPPEKRCASSRKELQDSKTPPQPTQIIYCDPTGIRTERSPISGSTACTAARRKAGINAADQPIRPHAR